MPVRKDDGIIVNETKKTRGRSKRNWIAAIKKDIIMLHVSKEMALNRTEWKKRFV